MKKQKSLAVNFMMNAFLMVSSFLFPLVTFPYASRILLPEGVGKVSFATSVVSYFAMIAQLGIPTYGVRACAKVRDDPEELGRTVQELFLINLAMSILAYVLLAAAVLHIPRLRQEEKLLMVISLTIFFNILGMEWLYKALEQYTYITVRSVAFKFLAVIALFLLVRRREDYIRYGAVTIFAASASNILNFFNIRRHVEVWPRGPYNLKRHIKAVAVFFAMSCAATVYTNLDSVMLGFMRSDADVGYYNAAVKVKTILLGIVTSLGTVLLPRVSYYMEKGLLEEFRRISGKALNFVLRLSVPMCVYFMVFAKESVYFLSGEAYTGSIIPMQVIMPTIVLVGLTNIMGIQMLVPMGKENCVLYSEIAGAVVDLALNAALIPRYGAAGAAAGTLAAETVVWIVQFHFLKGEAQGIYARVRYGLLVGAAAAGAVLSFWVKWTGWNVFIKLAVSACLYFSGYVYLMYRARDPLVLEIKDKACSLLRKLDYRDKE